MMQAITVKSKKTKSGKEMSSRMQTSEMMMNVSEKNKLESQSSAKDSKDSTKKVRELHKTTISSQPSAGVRTDHEMASQSDYISTVASNTIKSATTSSTSSSSFMSKKQKNEFSSEQVLSSVDLLDIENKIPISSVPIDVIDVIQQSTSDATFSKNSSTSMLQTENMSEKMTTSMSSTFYETSNQESSAKQLHTFVEKTVIDTAAVTSSPFADSAIKNSSSSSSTKNSHNKYETVKNSAPIVSTTANTAQEHKRLSQRTNVGASTTKSATTTTAASTTKTKSSHETQNNKLYDNEHIIKTTKKSNVNDNKIIKNVEKNTKTSEKNIHSSSIEENAIKTEFYDAKTKTWSKFNEQTITNKQKPTIVRYFSKEPNGKCRVIYKKKVYDQRNNKWKVIDEKIVDSNSTDAVYPEIIDDVINTTKTTYTTKFYNAKLGKWEIVDEKSYVDSQAYVPHDIACEIEKDNTDIANITTTSEVTKIFDASINKWRVLDEKTHTDVIEKILETPKKTVFVDEYYEIEKTNIESELNTNESSNLEKITRDVNINKNIYTNEDNISREVFLESKDLIDDHKRTRTNTWTKEDFEKENRVSSQLRADDQLTITEVSMNQENMSFINSFKSEGEFYLPKPERQMPIRPKDNLRPEGQFEVPEKEKYEYVEKRNQIIQKDNLKSEGEMTYKEAQEYEYVSRVEQKRPQDNLNPEGKFFTPEKQKYQPGERPTQIKPVDNLKSEGEFYIPEKQGFKPAERPTQKKPTDNLKPEGTFDVPDKPKYQPTEKVQGIIRKDNLTSEGEMTFTESQEYQYVVRPEQIKPIDNLSPEGKFYTPEKQKYQPGERPSQVKPVDNLKSEGDFYVPEKQGYKPAERPIQKKPVDNLKSEGTFDVPLKQKYHPGEKARKIIRKDTLTSEGEMSFTKSSEYQYVKRPEQIKPVDNLNTEGKFYIPEKTVFQSAEKVKKTIQKDNLRSEGEMSFKKTADYQFVRRPEQIKHQDNLKQEGVMNWPEKRTTITSRENEIKSSNVRKSTQQINKSSICLGTDNVILKSTNQMSYLSGKETSATSKSSKNDTPIDGMVMVTTKKVTTVVGGKARKEPETEYIKRQQKVNIVENIAKTTETKNVIQDKKEFVDSITSKENIHVNKNDYKNNCSQTVKTNQSTDSSTKNQSSMAKIFNHRQSEFSSEAHISNSVFHRKGVNSGSRQNESFSSNGNIQRKSILNLHEQSSASKANERQSYSSLHRQLKEHDTNGSISHEKSQNISSSKLDELYNKAKSVGIRRNNQSSINFGSSSSSQHYENTVRSVKTQNNNLRNMFDHSHVTFQSDKSTSHGLNHKQSDGAHTQTITSEKISCPIILKSSIVRKNVTQSSFVLGTDCTSSITSVAKSDFKNISSIKK